MNFDELFRISLQFQTLTSELMKNHLTIATMESCTAGLLASLLTDMEGSSAVFRGSFITYSNEAKIACGVPKEIISEYGVYSPEAADAMAQCCKNAFQTDIGIGVTGTFANADPNNADSTPGTVDYTIDISGNLFRCHLLLSPRTDRLQYKLSVAEAICSDLLMRIRMKS